MPTYHVETTLANNFIEQMREAMHHEVDSIMDKKADALSKLLFDYADLLERTHPSSKENK